MAAEDAVSMSTIYDGEKVLGGGGSPLVFACVRPNLLHGDDGI